MSLQTYEEARPWARVDQGAGGGARDAAVAHRPERRHPGVQGRSVADRQRYRDDRRLGRRRRAARQSGRHAGAARSSRTATSGPSASPISSCNFPSYTVPAAGPDLFPHVTAPTGLTEDRYIKAIQTRPDRPRIAPRRASRDYDDARGERRRRTGRSGCRRRRRAFIVEYASGKAPEIYPEISGVLLKAGSTLSLGNHLHSVGEEINSRGRGRLPAVSEGRSAEVHPLFDASRRSDADRQRLARHSGRHGRARRRLHAAHQAGQDHRLAAAHAHPRQVSVPRADLPGQSQQRHEARNRSTARTGITTGTRSTTTRTRRRRWCRPDGIHIISWHDNSAANRNNPDPQNWVGYGDRTIDEMGFSWIGWIDLTRRGIREGARRSERGAPEERVLDAAQN